MVDMSEAAAVAKPAMKANQAWVVGRINHVGGFDSNGKRVHEARIAIPAVDAYSMPGAVMVQSAHRIGSVGDDVKLLVEVTGFPDKFTNKGTGEVTQTARNVLRVVE
jgi:hypothetical protein